MPADREHVRRDHEHRRELTPDARKPDEPGETEDTGDKERDVLTGDGEQVVEPGRTEVALHVRREPFILAEYDAQHDASAHSARPAPDGTLDAVAQAIAEALDSAPPPDFTPARRLEHDVDALPGQPRALVETVLRRPRLLDVDRRVQNRPTRRRAPCRQYEQDALPQRLVTELRQHGEHTRRPLRLAGRRNRHERPLTGLADPCRKDARGDRVHPQRSPSETEHGEHGGKRPDPRGAVDAQRDAESDEHDRHGERERHREPDGERQTRARRGDEKRRPVEFRDAFHCVTRSRSCSIRVGPMPGTASRSSTDANGPCSAR